MPDHLQSEMWNRPDWQMQSPDSGSSGSIVMQPAEDMPTQVIDTESLDDLVQEALGNNLTESAFPGKDRRPSQILKIDDAQVVTPTQQTLLQNSKPLKRFNMLKQELDSVQKTINAVVNKTNSIKTTTMQCPHCNRVFNSQNF